MKRRRAWGLAQLLLLAAAVPCLQASLFDTHIVHPKSYLETLKSTRGDQMLSTNAAPAACDPSAAGSCQHSASHPQLLYAQQPPAVLNSGLASSWNVGTTSAGASSDPTRSLQQRAANPLRLQPPYNVCVSSWEPMVRCTASADQSEYQGYQIELFRMAAVEVGWAETDYFFTCMDCSTMMADLNDSAGNCSLSAAGVEVLPASLAAGLKFSWPTYKSGLRVMKYTHLTSGSTWAFSEIFRWEVWLLLAATAIGVGLLVGILEVANRTKPATASHGKHPNWQSWEWYSLAKVVHVIPHVGDPRADASRVLILGYGFLVLVMVSMYTAVAASRITAAALVHPVHNVRDLAGQGNPLTTLAWDQYVQNLNDHQDIHAIGMQWERDGDLQDGGRSEERPVFGTDPGRTRPRAHGWHERGVRPVSRWRHVRDVLHRARLPASVRRRRDLRVLAEHRQTPDLPRSTGHAGERVYQDWGHRQVLWQQLRGPWERGDDRAAPSVGPVVYPAHDRGRVPGPDAAVQHPQGPAQDGHGAEAQQIGEAEFSRA